MSPSGCAPSDNGGDRCSQCQASCNLKTVKACSVRSMYKRYPVIVVISLGIKYDMTDIFGTGSVDSVSTVGRRDSDGVM